MFETNVLALPATFHPFIAPMKARGRGTLVGIASVAGIRGLPGSEAYCASKSAVITYCESLRVELAKSNLRVVTISPGFIRTPLTAENPYRMPFLMDANDFARGPSTRSSPAFAIARSRGRWACVSALLSVMPRWLFDRLTRRRKQKPRAAT